MIWFLTLFCIWKRIYDGGFPGKIPQKWPQYFTLFPISVVHLYVLGVAIWRRLHVIEEFELIMSLEKTVTIRTLYVNVNSKKKYMWIQPKSGYFHHFVQQNFMILACLDVTAQFVAYHAFCIVLCMELCVINSHFHNYSHESIWVFDNLSCYIKK